MGEQQRIADGPYMMNFPAPSTETLLVTVVSYEGFNGTEYRRIEGVGITQLFLDDALYRGYTFTPLLVLTPDVLETLRDVLEIAADDAGEVRAVMAMRDMLAEAGGAQP